MSDPVVSEPPAEDQEYWRAKFIDAINRDRLEPGPWGDQVRDALRGTFGTDGPVE